MFYKFLRKNSIVICTILVIAIVFMFGMLFGVIIGFNNTKAAEQTNNNKYVDEIEITPNIDNAAVVEVSSPVNMGEFKLTAYCPCVKCSGEWGTQTSTGTTATQGRTVAVDPSVIPYGSTLIINGAEYVAEDCGGAIKGNKIDIYFNSHEDAKRFGVQTADIFLKVNKG